MAEMFIEIGNIMAELDEECPLCMEPLEIDDLNFFPCTCGYQICRFCWHRIRTDENGLCPACRKAYSENPADFKPLSQEELHNVKKERKQKETQRRQKLTESKKYLASVRVVQKNLVFVVGLGPRLADPECLKKNEFFGKFGKILKAVVNHTTTYAGAQGPSASAYITYLKDDDALKAIQAVNNLYVDGRTVKASLGTTKYCSSFLNSTTCPKPVTCPRADCMYLHELGDDGASFTKEEMQLGKHTEFEQRLHETLNRSEMANAATAVSAGGGTTGFSVSGTNGSVIDGSPPVETPVPLMPSAGCMSTASTTIVSLMGLDLSNIPVRKKASSQSPPPPPSRTLEMDARGVIKTTASNRGSDTTEGMEWPALGSSKSGGGGGGGGGDFGGRENSLSSEVSEVEVASFSNIVNKSEKSDRNRDKEKEATGNSEMAMEMIGAATAESDKDVAAKTKGKKKNARKDNGGIPCEDVAGVGGAANAGDSKPKAGNKEATKKQTKESQDKNKNAKATNKGDKANRKKSKDESSGKKGNGTKAATISTSPTPRDSLCEGSAKAEKPEPTASKKQQKQQSSLNPIPTPTEIVSAVYVSHLPPSPSPSPPFSSSPTSSQSSSLSSTPPSSSTAPTDHTCDSTIAAPASPPTTVVPPTEPLSPPTPSASPSPDSGCPQSDSNLTYPFTHPRQSASTSALPINISDDNPNCSFFSNQYSRMRLQQQDVDGSKEEEEEEEMFPGCDGDALGTQPRLGATDLVDVELQQEKQKETDWSAAFGFGSSSHDVPLPPTKVEDVDEDEDLGFDPFGESQRGLEDLLRGETGCESQPDPIYSHSRIHGSTGFSQYGHPPMPHLGNESHFPTQQQYLLQQQQKSGFSRPNHSPHNKFNQTSSLFDGILHSNQHLSNENSLVKDVLAATESSKVVNPAAGDSPTHPPGFFPRSSSNINTQTATSRLLGLTSAQPGSNSNVHHHQTQNLLQSLLFDNISCSDSRTQLEMQQQFRPQPPNVPPPPPGLGPQQPYYGNSGNTGNSGNSGNTGNTGNSGNSGQGQRLPPGFSPDSLLRGPDDFMGNSWSKFEKRLHPSEQQQQQQSSSKMLGLMNLGSPRKEDLDSASTSFPPRPHHHPPNPSHPAHTKISGFGQDNEFDCGFGLNTYGAQHRNPASGSSSSSLLTQGDHSSPTSHTTSSSVKDWQEGFRALLPNVNISFGQGANSSSVGGNAGSSGIGFGSALPPTPWDDPAIVTAANVSKPSNNNNNNNNNSLRNSFDVKGSQDDQPHWMKSLQQMTEIPESPAQNPTGTPSAFLPTLAGVNNPSLLNGPSFYNNNQSVHQQQWYGKKMPSERLFQMGGNGGGWPNQHSANCGPPSSMTSAPPGFRLPNSGSGAATASGNSN